MRRRCWRSSAGPGGLRGQRCSASWIHSGGTHEPGDPVLGAQSDDVAGEEVVHEHDVRAVEKAVVSWLKPASKLSGQRRQDHVVLVVAEVVADALGPDDEVAVREDDALGRPVLPDV